MTETHRGKRLRIIIILIIAIAVLAFTGLTIYRSRSTRLLDRDVFNEFKTAVDERSKDEDGGFADQRELMDFIEKWADSKSLEYKEDRSGNIIFDKPAVGRKSNVTPTLIAVSMDYETAAYDSGILASAAAIASSEIESGRRTVVFFNDEKNSGEGYKKIGNSYLSPKSKVIYLDRGSSNYISTASFEERFSVVDIPSKREKNRFDSAVRVSVTGIRSGIIGPAISDQPDPLSALSSLLTRLKSRSVDCRLAEVKTGSNGNMYPVSMEAVIVLNSYNLASFTAYIDKQIKDWNKDYADSHESIEYTYEVIEENDELPEYVYDSESTARLTGILYTIKGGAYNYSEGDSIPEGRKAEDVYGINCLTGLETEKNRFRLRMITQGVNDQYTERMVNDNRTAALLYNCSYSDITVVPAFSNDRNALSRTFNKTYEKVSDPSSVGSRLKMEYDNVFTPCSFLAEKNSKSDIIHVRTKASNAATVANTILCYIKTKGNTSIFR